MRCNIIKTKQKRKKFNVFKSIKTLNEIISELPKADEVYKMISKGGFASISFIMFVAERTKINNLYVSTFRVGKKESLVLNKLHTEGTLDHAEFVFFELMNETDDKYGYFKTLRRVADQNDWKMSALKNHSKVILFDTDMGKYVIETSSNLNENPKIEQFSFEKDEELYEFYKKEIFEGGE